MGVKRRMRMCNFSMRLREQEEALLDAKADEVGMTKSDYIRNAILFASAKERPRYNAVFAEEMLHELNEIGNKVNEVAHMVNGRRAVLSADLNTLTEEYTKLLAVYDKFVRDEVKNPY